MPAGISVTDAVDVDAAAEHAVVIAFARHGVVGDAAAGDGRDAIGGIVAVLHEDAAATAPGAVAVDRAAGHGEDGLALGAKECAYRDAAAPLEGIVAGYGAAREVDVGTIEHACRRRNRHSVDQDRGCCLCHRRRGCP